LDREDVRFRSGDAECAGWLFRPEAAGGDAGCVVIAHGFGGVKEARLGAYAERFAAAGSAALVFDYRHFGDSGGEPRLLIDIRRQQADWRAAIAYARALEGVDGGRIALWGTSFSGGHVIELATEGDDYAAVIAQSPYTDGIATLRSAGLADNVRMSRAAIADVIGAAFGDPPRLMPVVAPPGHLAAMNSPDAEPGYLALFPPGYAWPNRFIPRATLPLPGYRPVARAHKVRAPLLVQVMSDDAVTPPGPARKVAERAPRGELVEYEGGHFDIYVGEPFERAVGDQIAFLRRHLGEPA
jgi:dienelactone hydrolase